MTYFEKMWEDETERENNFYNKMGKLIGYTGEECISCKRLRVEEFDSGIKVCEKCGTDQKTGQIYENEYGTALEFYF